MEKKLEISDFEIDALKETANIGTGNASVALSSLMNKKVNLGLPLTNFVSVLDVHKYISCDRESVVGIFSNIKEGIEGNILLLMPLSSAIQLIDKIGINRIRERDCLNDDDIVILKKLGSILYSAYLTSLAKFFELKIIFHPPKIVSTIGNSIIDFIVVRIGEKEKVLLITVGYDIEETKINGSFILLFTMASLLPLLDKFKKKMGMA